jgi:hypothetical protein
MILRWCFDVLTKNSISHLLICHQLPKAPRHQPPTPSDRQIPSSTSSRRVRQNIKVRNGRQVDLSGNILQLTHDPHFSDTCSTRLASSTYPMAAINPFWITNTLEYLVDDVGMKYGGKMLMKFTILHDFQWTHLSLVQICYEWRQWIKILGLLCKYWKWRWHSNRFRFG